MNNGFLIIETFSCFFETFVLMEVMAKLFGIKNKSFSFFCLFLGYMSGIAFGSILCTTFIPILGFASLWGYAVLLVYAVHLLNGKIVYKLITLLILFLLIFSIDIALLQVLSRVYKVDTSTVMSQNGIKAILYLSAKLLLFVITRVILFLRHKELNEYNKGYWWISGIMSSLSLLIMLSTTRMLVTVSYQVDDLNIFSSIIALFIVNIIIYYLILRISSDSILINKSNLINQHNEILIHHYEEYENSHKQLSRIYHDFQNHILYMGEYIKNEEYDKLRRYFGDLQEDFPDLAKTPPTGNTTVDAVLGFKLSKAIQKGITLNISGTVPYKIKINDYEMCSILANLLDNAMEACDMFEANKDKFINCNFSGRKGRLKIEVINPVKKYEKDFSTLKPDKELHGIGLESIKLTAAKNGGMTHFRIENGIFYSTIFVRI